MEVRVFKLITGAEVVAEYIDVSGTGYKIRRPLQVHFMRGPDGSEQMAFSHFTLSVDPNQDMELLDAAVAMKPMTALPEIEQSYIQNTSGIIVPPASTGKILTG